MAQDNKNRPKQCERCGKDLHRLRSESQCIYCGHRTETLTAQFTNRAIQFLVGNAVVWLAIAFGVARLSMSVGFATTIGTAFCLFGGLLLRRYMSLAGDWIAVALTAAMAFAYFDSLAAK